MHFSGDVASLKNWPGLRCFSTPERTAWNKTMKRKTVSTEANWLCVKKVCRLFCFVLVLGVFVVVFVFVLFCFVLCVCVFFFFSFKTLIIFIFQMPQSRYVASKEKTLYFQFFKYIIPEAGNSDFKQKVSMKLENSVRHSNIHHLQYI